MSALQDGGDGTAAPWEESSSGKSTEDNIVALNLAMVAMVAKTIQHVV